MHGSPDIDAVRTELTAQFGMDAAAVHAVSQLVGGWEATLFRLHLDGPDAVVRRFSGEHAARKVEIELSALQALAAVGYPVPAVSGANLDPSNVFGDPYLLIEYIDGDVLMTDPTQPIGPRVAELLIDLMIELHSVDPAAVELPAGVTGQAALRRITSRWREGPDPDLAWLGRWIADGISGHSGRIAATHGDFHPGNIMLRSDGRPCVIDWTSVQLTDPREDVAWTYMLTLGYVGADFAEQFVGAYVAKTGRELDMTFHTAYVAALRLDELRGTLVSGAESVGMNRNVIDQLSDHLPAYRRIADLLATAAGRRFGVFDQMLADLEDDEISG